MYSFEGVIAGYFQRENYVLMHGKHASYDSK